MKKFWISTSLPLLFALSACGGSEPFDKPNPDTTTQFSQNTQIIKGEISVLAYREGHVLTRADLNKSDDYTQGSYALLKTWVQELPTPMLVALNGYKILLGNDLGDVYPSYRSMIDNGYTDILTDERKPFIPMAAIVNRSSKEIFTAIHESHYQAYNSIAHGRLRGKFIFLHESCHLLDDSLGIPSKNEKLLTAYKADIEAAKSNNLLWIIDPYFLTRENGGDKLLPEGATAELFAEACAQNLMDKNNLPTYYRALDLNFYAPNFVKATKEIMAEALKRFQFNSYNFTLYSVDGDKPTTITDGYEPN